MLDHQIGFSLAIKEIYMPISGRLSDPDSTKPEGNPEGIEACTQYQAIVEELKSTLAPELEMIETRIIRPADELMEVIKLIRKMATKRQHKQLDFDRHTTTHKKLQEKKERTIKDEKALMQVEGQLELATQEFNQYNELLKEELPKLFQLEREFIKPLFQSFYYMQLNVFYTLHERMQRLDIPYFDLSIDIEGAFFKKQDDVVERAEVLTIVHFKTHGQKASRIGTKNTIYGKKEGEVTKLTPPPKPTSKPASKFGSGTSTPVGTRRATLESKDAPPSYQAAVTSTNPIIKPSDTLKPAHLNLNVGRSNSTGSSFSAAGKPKPPPPKPKPLQLVAPTEKATAMYDFEPQAEGDLGFKAGDIIDIVLRTPNENEVSTITRCIILSYIIY